MSETPQWEKEHGPEYRPEQAILDLLAIQGVADWSWHNDTQCRFGYRRATDDACLWFDHPDASKREVSGGDRYLVTLEKRSCEEPYTVLSTDDASLAAQAFRELIEKRLGEPEQSRKAFFKALKEFRDKAWALSIAWEQMPVNDQRAECVTAEYPFDKSFDDICHQIDNWQGAIEIGDWDLD